MIVVDSNVLAYLYLPGEYSTAAEALLEQDFGRIPTAQSHHI
jgi:predicted nucleic acid-binding protein